MIEIPALEQPAYDQRELDQLQEQYNQLSVDSPDDALSDNTIRDFSGQEIMGPPAQTDQSHSSDQFAQTADQQHGLEVEAIPDLEPREPDLQPEIHTELRPAQQSQTDFARQSQTDLAHQSQTDLADPGLENDLYPEPASLPLAHMAHSPMAVDSYFSAQTRTAESSGEPYSSHESQNGFGVDPMPPKDEEALYSSAGAFMIRRNPVKHSNVVAALRLRQSWKTIRRMAYATLKSPESQILDSAPKPALAKPFTSPRFVEPSPQLPPPLSAKSSRLAFPLNEEYAQVRRSPLQAKARPGITLLYFTQFVQHARHGLNFCLEYPLSHEPPIIELLTQKWTTIRQCSFAQLHLQKQSQKPIIGNYDIRLRWKSK
ncbi:Cell morphoproteinsis protein PAG1 [Clavispora lusitaniae]|nr:Cell morphoproteinsis protein PAG1 [Clavispora lusitaniae]